MAIKQVSVVVIGGSHAGVGVCHGLLRQVPNAQVTLISPSRYYYFNIPAPRIIAKPGSLSPDKYMYSITDIFQKSPKTLFSFIEATVTQISVEERLLSIRSSSPNSSSLSTVPFDYLVIASGSTTYATVGKDSLKVPFKINGVEDLAAVIKESQSKIQQAKSIIIGGAGPIGVEFAGELAEAFEGQKEVTLVSATELPLPGVKDAVRETAARILRSKKVNILSGRTVRDVQKDQGSKKWTVSLSSGEILTADAYVSAMGVLPNNSFIPPSFLDEKGWVTVDGYLRVRQRDDIASARDTSIYALGDITTHRHRLLSRIPKQVKTVVNNLAYDITRDGTQIRYTPEEERKMMIVPIGASTGTGQLGNWVVPGCLVWYFKGRDFLTYKAPSFVYGKH